MQSWTRETGCPTHFFSLIIVRHPQTLKFLAVEETNNRGWWLPGGFCEPGDSHEKTALKETLEEAGLAVELKGILCVQSAIRRTGARQRVIYFAEPVDPAQEPKSVPDTETISAKWLTVAELEAMQLISPPNGLRGDELLVWARYLNAGGPIYPLCLLATDESMPPRMPTKEEAQRMTVDLKQLVNAPVSVPEEKKKSRWFK